MKNFQQTLLIVLALGLCGLCVYQWYGQTSQRNQIETLNHALYEQAAAIRGYTNSIKTLDSRISQMMSELAEQSATGQTNEQLIAVQKGELNKLQLAAEGLTNHIGEYKKAVDKLEGQLKEAYAGIQKQNDALGELVAQRDEFVKKFNDSVKDRNEIVGKYNDLAAQMEKIQGASKK
jgi:chromosome segregation ATPase